MTKTKQKVEMPKSIKGKLLGAVAMLLVSVIMVVSATYAWFTLSTAPEVTGITTSVGANGNLEIALFTTDTYNTPASISSKTGDSSAVQAVTAANITWGNLVDLSDSSYGLANIKLLPAQANYTDVAGTQIADLTKLLKTPVYGADGRVATVEANTVSAIYNSGFTYDSTTSQTYGVRAVGVASNLSDRQISFNSAKTAFTSAKSGAGKAVSTAVNANATGFLAIALAGGEPSSFSASQVSSMKAIAEGAQASLANIVKAYANAGLAVAASSSATDEQVSILKSAIASETSAADLKTSLNYAGVTTYDSVLDTLATAQTTVADALTACGTYAAGANTTDAVTAVQTSIVTPLIGAKSTMKAYDAAGADATLSSANIDTIKSVYLGGGVMQTIAAQTGVLNLTSMAGVNVYGGEKGTTGALNTVATAVNGLAAPAGAATATIADTYGYVLDFAFRTNAADSSLMLQTSAVNRVYESETDANLATQGAGSTVTYTYAGDTTAAQAEALLNNVKIVFYNPADGTVYAKASLTGVNAGTTSATANVKLVGQDGDTAAITTLTQNDVAKVSVLVYLDGENITNASVVNGDTSGSLDLNLQFSSSADLIPMDNTALKTMTK